MAFCTGKNNGLIRGQPLAFIYRAPFDDSVYGICFLSGHEKYAVLLKIVKPLIVRIRTVFNNNRPFRKIERFEKNLGLGKLVRSLGLKFGFLPWMSVPYPPLKNGKKNLIRVWAHFPLKKDSRCHCFSVRVKLPCYVRFCNSDSSISTIFIRCFSNPIFNGVLPWTGTDMRAVFPAFA